MIGIMYIIIFACGLGGMLREPIHVITNMEMPISRGVM
jgi:hypothetical protein